MVNGIDTNLSNDSKNNNTFTNNKNNFNNVNIVNNNNKLKYFTFNETKIEVDKSLISYNSKSSIEDGKIKYNFFSNKTKHEKKLQCKFNKRENYKRKGI